MENNKPELTYQEAIIEYFNASIDTWHKDGKYKYDAVDHEIGQEDYKAKIAGFIENLSSDELEFFLQGCAVIVEGINAQDMQDQMHQIIDAAMKSGISGVQINIRHLEGIISSSMTDIPLAD